MAVVAVCRPSVAHHLGPIRHAQVKPDKSQKVQAASSITKPNCSPASMMLSGEPAPSLVI
jgi:hypothetical protein